MKVIALKGEERNGVGKSNTKQLRKEGKVPCVVYGGKDNKHFAVYQADFKDLVYSPNSHLVSLNIGKEQKLVKVQDIQFHPVSEDIIHADFYEIDVKSPIDIRVPVQIEGSSPGVRAGGKLQLKIKKLNVSALVTDLPESIVVNIEELEIGKSVRVRDITVPGLTLLDSEANSIVSCVVTRAAQSEGLDEEGLDEEGEEGEATEGAADAPAE